MKKHGMEDTRTRDEKHEKPRKKKKKRWHREREKTRSARDSWTLRKRQNKRSSEDGRGEKVCEEQKEETRSGPRCWRACKAISLIRADVRGSYSGLC